MTTAEPGRMTSATHLLYAVEAILWSVAAAVASATLLATWRAEFPARTESLAWEAGLLIAAATLAGTGVARVLRGRGWWPREGAEPSPVVVVRSLLRLALVVPWAVLLLVAAAGFSA